MLEINISGGRKMLDTKNANYSFGAMHSVWRIALGKIKPEDHKNILVLGMGGGSVVDLLMNKYNHKGKLTAVEYDPVIVKIAEEEFGIKTEKNLEVICDDAFKFIRNTKIKYDLIIIDLFNDSDLVEGVYDIKFWQDIKTHLTEGGIFLFNAFQPTPKLNQLERQITLESFKLKVYEKVNGSNVVWRGRGLHN